MINKVEMEKKDDMNIPHAISNPYILEQLHGKLRQMVYTAISKTWSSPSSRQVVGDTVCGNNIH